MNGFTDICIQFKMFKTSLTWLKSNVIISSINRPEDPYDIDVPCSELPGDQIIFILIEFVV